MDVNYLFLRQQVERSLAETADSAAARQAHEDLARAYELQIERKSGGRILFDRRNEDRASAEQEMLIIGLSSPSATS
ncbi:MAG: hypothetical protein ACJ8EH_04985 [Sphingomicrobium sp.]